MHTELLGFIDIIYILFIEFIMIKSHKEKYEFRSQLDINEHFKVNKVLHRIWPQSITIGS